MTREQLEEIRKRAEAATPGPWEASFPTGADCQWIDVTTAYGAEDELIGTVLPREHMCNPEGVEALQKLTRQRMDDVEFIAHARTDVPALLAEIERLRAILQQKPPAD